MGFTVKKDSEKGFSEGRSEKGVSRTPPWRVPLGVRPIVIQK